MCLPLSVPRAHLPCLTPITWTHLQKQLQIPSVLSDILPPSCKDIFYCTGPTQAEILSLIASADLGKTVYPKVQGMMMLVIMGVILLFTA